MLFTNVTLFLRKYCDNIKSMCILIKQQNNVFLNKRKPEFRLFAPFYSFQFHRGPENLLELVIYSLSNLNV